MNSSVHHVGISYRIEINQQLKYDIDKHNLYWITCGPWYNIYICKNYMEKCLKIVLEMQELTDINLRVILMKIRNISHNMLMTVSVVEVMHYHQMRQQKH